MMMKCFIFHLAGAVILESPIHPVMEGDSVTFRCREGQTHQSRIADFYRDGFYIGTGYKGEMTIHSVSRSDKGLYKCSISEAGDSQESWLAVRGKGPVRLNQSIKICLCFFFLW